MLSKKIFIISALFTLFQYSGLAQKTDSIPIYSISARYGYGFVYAHHKSFNYFIEDYPQTFELDLTKRTNGRKIWHQVYKYPTVGFGYEHSTLGNKQILGNANALLCFISIPIVENKSLKFSYKCAAGAAFLSEKFDLYNNNYNIAIGSHLNAYLNLNLDLDVKIIDKPKPILTK